MVVTAFAETIPVPAGQEYFELLPFEKPVVNTDLSKASPIGFGSAAQGGDVLSIQISFAEFEGPVDIYLGIQISSNDIYLVKNDSTIQLLSDGLTPWKKNVTGPINETLWGDIQTSVIPPGVYNFYLLITPANEFAASGVRNSSVIHATDAQNPQYTIIKLPLLVISKPKCATLLYDYNFTWQAGTGAQQTWRVSGMAYFNSSGTGPGSVTGIGGGDLTFTQQLTICGPIGCSTCYEATTGISSIIFTGSYEEAYPGSTNVVLHIEQFLEGFDFYPTTAICDTPVGTITVPMDEYFYEPKLFLLYDVRIPFEDAGHKTIDLSNYSIGIVNGSANFGIVMGCSK
jgi:hypothetical protein